MTRQDTPQVTTGYTTATCQVAALTTVPTTVTTAKQWHIISRDEQQCATVQGTYDDARQAALSRNWLMLDLGWCPLCHFCSLGGNEADLTDRTGYPSVAGRPAAP